MSSGAPAPSGGKLMEDIKSLEGLFDLVMKDSEERLKFKSSELGQLQSEMQRWREEALRRQKETESIIEDRNQLAEAMAQKLEQLRVSYESDLKRRTEDLEIVAGERDRWKSEVDKLNVEIRVREQAHKSAIELLQIENESLRERLAAKDITVSADEQTAADKQQEMLAEVQKWKEEYYKQRVYGEQKNQVLLDKVNQLTDEVKRWKDKLYQQKLEYETELKKRSVMVDQMRAEMVRKPAVYPDNVGTQAAAMNSPVVSEPRSSISSSSAAGSPAHMQQSPMPHGSASQASGSGRSPPSSGLPQVPALVRTASQRSTTTVQSASLQSPRGTGPTTPRGTQQKTLLKTATTSRGSPASGAVASPNLTPRQPADADEEPHSATLTSTPALTGNGAKGTFSTDLAQRIEVFGDALDRKTDLIDALVARVMRLQDELAEDRSASHPVLSSLQAVQRQLADRAHALELEFRSDVSNAYERVHQLMMDAERWKVRLERASGMSLPVFVDVGCSALPSTADSSTDTGSMDPKSAVNEHVEELLGELSRWKWEVRSLMMKWRSSVQLHGKASNPHDLRRVDELLARINSLEMAAEEERARSKRSDMEAAKWKDISLLMLPLMELLNMRSPSAGGVTAADGSVLNGLGALTKDELTEGNVMETALRAARSGHSASFLPMLETLLERALSHTTANGASMSSSPFKYGVEQRTGLDTPSVGSVYSHSELLFPESRSMDIPVVPVSLLDDPSVTTPYASMDMRIRSRQTTPPQQQHQHSNQQFAPSDHLPYQVQPTPIAYRTSPNGDASQNGSPATQGGSQGQLLWTYSQPPTIEGSFVQAFVASRIDEAIFGVHGAGHLDGYVKRAAFNMPVGLTANRAGTVVYVAEHGNHCIRKINLVDGLVVTVTNMALGTKKNSLLKPNGLAISGDEQHLLVADSKRNSVLRVDIRSGASLLVAGLPAIRGKHSIINDLLADDEDHIYVSHTRGIGRLHLKSRVFTDVCSGAARGYADGPLDHAAFNNPTGLCFLSPLELLVADTENHRIRLVDLRGRRVTTFAGCGIPGYEDGSAQNAQFNMPAKLVFDSARGVVFVSEQGDHIRVIDVHNRLCSTISIASFNSPNGLCWIPSRGVLAVADTFNHGVRILSFADLQPSA